LAALQRDVANAADAVSAEVAWDLDLREVSAAAQAPDVGCVVLPRGGAHLPRSVSGLRELSSRCARPVLWLGASAPTAGRRVVLPYEGEASRAVRGVALLRSTLEASDRLTLLAVGDPDPALSDEAGLRELTGLRCTLSAESLGATLINLAERLEAYLDEHPADLVVLAPEALAPATRTATRWLAWGSLIPTAPSVLALPPPDGDRRDALDAPDVLLLGGAVRIAAARRGIFDQLTPPKQPVYVLGLGRDLGVIDLSAGPALVDLPDAPTPTVLALGREEPSVEDPLAAAEVRVAVVDPAGRALVLVDAELGAGPLARIQGACGDALCLAVRLHPKQACASLRGDLPADVPLVDAGALLDDGDPEDLPREATGVRLLRVANHLRAAGLAVPVVVTARTPLRPLAGSSQVRALGADVAPEELAATLAEATPPIRRADSVEQRLDALTDSRLSPGNAVAVELDNQAAREHLLGLIEGARERVHVQTYILADDALGQALEAALTAAAKRGVRVRLLVDALYAGALGDGKPLVDRLEAAEGVELRIFRPLPPVPSVLDLKLRSHRKLVVADGRRAVVSGRNLAATYFTGFGEVTVTPTTPFLELPWLDSGARLEGPLVAHVERAFHADWEAAGGEAFPVETPGPAGDVRARLVLHDGLRDAHGLEAYLVLIRAARSRLLLVNTFPLARELEHALLGALARGVELRILIGNIRPKAGDDRRPFQEAHALRTVADDLVRGHLDALVAAGADVREFTLTGQPGWDPELGPVWPHVHAKLLCADGLRCAVGSANFDITAAFWESEALLVIEDEGVSARLEAELQALLDAATPLGPEDPRWQEEAARRAWLTRHWPKFLG
jgi:phosphatidylserine/phosphatidylglycerophosphate/cardiolipin synthase-like enzyme